jgi:hypothetical protein
MFRRDIAGRLGFGPSTGLRMVELDLAEVAQLNRETAMSCHRWTFERPQKRFAARLHIPDAPDSLVVDPEIELCDELGASEVYRFYGRSRWQGDLRATPWPVEWWWQ